MKTFWPIYIDLVCFSKPLNHPHFYINKLNNFGNFKSDGSNQQKHNPRSITFKSLLGHKQTIYYQSEVGEAIINKEMEEHGILGTKPRKQSASRIRGRTWLKRREIWLVALGIALHAVYMLSIFDIYFKSPIVHGMDPVPPRFTPPAKRLVLLVGNHIYWFVPSLHTNCSIICSWLMDHGRFNFSWWITSGQVLRARFWWELQSSVSEKCNQRTRALGCVSCSSSYRI